MFHHCDPLAEVDAADADLPCAFRAIASDSVHHEYTARPVTSFFPAGTLRLVTGVRTARYLARESVQPKHLGLSL